MSRRCLFTKTVCLHTPAFRFLLVDSRPRRIALTVPSGLPTPLLSTALDILFTRFQAPLVSLLSSAVMSTVAGGVRSALVIDLGWAETTVTSVYEYREVRSSRCVRGGRQLLNETHELLKATVSRMRGQDATRADGGHMLSFKECEDLSCRLAWCRSATNSSSAESRTVALPTVQEHDELEVGSDGDIREDDLVAIPLENCPFTSEVKVTFGSLADVCERTFLDLDYDPASFDDHEMPVHLLAYHHLLQLPMDVRAVCMSRIIFTGGCSNIPGLKGRIFQEVSGIYRERGWDPVRGKAVRPAKTNPPVRAPSSEAESKAANTAARTDQDGVWHDAANVEPEIDPIEEQLKRGREERGVLGTLRSIESLGPWAGASMSCQLRVPAMANVERENWQLHGASGASRPGDVDVRAQQRQSMGPGGLMRGAGGSNQANWTLGIWGYS